MGNWNIYNIAYILSNLFMTYVIYRFIKIFYRERKIERKLELGTYIGYFVIITILNIFINIPILLMVANLVLFLY